MNKAKRQPVRLLKLVSGESLVSFVKTDNRRGKVHVDTPLLVHIRPTNFGASLALTKWMPFVDDNKYVLDRKHIIANTQPSEELYEHYISAVMSLAGYETAAVDGKHINAPTSGAVH